MLRGARSHAGTSPAASPSDGRSAHGGHGLRTRYSTDRTLCFGRSDRHAPPDLPADHPRVDSRPRRAGRSVSCFSRLGSNALSARGSSMFAPAEDTRKGAEQMFRRNPDVPGGVLLIAALANDLELCGAAKLCFYLPRSPPMFFLRVERKNYLTWNIVTSS